jgi:hypothetical protein
MKLKQPQVQRLVRAVFDRLKSRKLIEFKKSEAEVMNHAIELVNQDSNREDDLVREVNKMLDDLEKQNPGGFDRHKMFLLLKAKLAKQKGIVL